MIRRRSWPVLLLGVVAATATADEKSVVTPTKTIFSDELTTSFSPDWHLNHGEWKIVDGGFRAVENTSENHPAAARYRTGILFADVVFEFDFRLDGAKMAALSINDYTRHLCHIRVLPTGLQLLKDDTDMKGPDKSAVVATTKTKLAAGAWHHLKITIAGDQITADMDGVTVVGKHAQFAEPKENFAFIVGGDSASFRKMRVSVPVK